MAIIICPTEEKDLAFVQKLWANPDVMYYVGFPNGLQQSEAQMQAWYAWLQKSKPLTMHYSIFEDEIYCGETFFEIDTSHDCLACMDIKLLPAAQGKGIAYQALGFALAQAKAHGAKIAFVDPDPQNKKAIALYNKLGFVPCTAPAHILAQEEDYDCVYMEKAL